VLGSLAMQWLIPRITAFQSIAPDIDLRLSALGINVDFDRDEIDVSISYGHKTDWPNCYCRKLFDDELILVASPKFKGKYPAIYVDAALRAEDWPAWCQHAKIPEPKPEKRIYFQNTSQALLAAINGAGILVTHKPFINDAVKSGQLKQISKKTLPLDKSYYLIYPKQKKTNKAIEKFSRWLMQEASNMSAVET